MQDLEKPCESGISGDEPASYLALMFEITVVFFECGVGGIVHDPRRRESKEECTV